MVAVLSPLLSIRQTRWIPSPARENEPTSLATSGRVGGAVDAVYPLFSMLRHRTDIPAPKPVTHASTLHPKARIPELMRACPPRLYDNDAAEERSSFHWEVPM